LEFANSFIEIFNSDINNDINIVVVCILIMCCIFEIFIVLVLLEIIELGFCGLNYNTKRNIKERALNDSKLLNEIRTPTEESVMIDE
jgi:hypothetical protein